MSDSTTSPKPRKAKRRLLKIRVGELSLVDKHCVPSASFLIAKRLTDEAGYAPRDVPTPGTAGRTNEAVAQAFLKAITMLKKVAGQMNPADLELLARVIQYTNSRFGQVPAIAAADLIKSRNKQMQSNVRPEVVAALQNVHRQAKSIERRLALNELKRGIDQLAGRMESFQSDLAHAARRQRVA